MQGSAAGQVTTVAASTVHLPDTQVSLPLHRLPSSNCAQSAAPVHLQSGLGVPSQTLSWQRSLSVQGSPSSQGPSTGVEVQPWPGLHPSAVQGLPSSQVRAPEPSAEHRPSMHHDSSVHGSPSSHGALSGAGAATHDPVVVSQTATWHGAIPAIWPRHSAWEVQAAAAPSDVSAVSPAAPPPSGAVAGSELSSQAGCISPTKASTIAMLRMAPPGDRAVL